MITARLSVVGFTVSLGCSLISLFLCQPISAQPPTDQLPTSQRPSASSATSSTSSNSTTTNTSQIGTATSPAANAATATQAKSPTPAELARQAELRRVFFFPADAAKLVPSDYWPVGIEELQAVLEEQTEVAKPGFEVPQLISAVYVARFADGALVSDDDASLFDIAYRDDVPSTLLLGEMNLALNAQTAAAIRNQPARLVTTADGMVRAIVTRDSRLRFGWSRRGTLGPDDRYQFDLQIPPCSRTRFYFGIPNGMRLSAQDGVVTQLPSPPQEVGAVASQAAGIWYSIEAGGLSRIRLTIGAISPRLAAGNVYAVRDLGLDCTVTAAGIDWTAKLAVDIPAGQGIPTISVQRGGRITAVRLNGETVSWKEKANEAELQLQIGSNVFPSNTASGPNTLQVSGVVGLSSLQFAETTSDDVPLLASQSLPWLQISGAPRVIASATHQVLLRIDDPLLVTETTTGDEWQLVENSLNANRKRRTLQFIGPVDLAPPAIRLVQRSGVPRTDSALRLQVQEAIIRGTWEAEIAIDNGSIDPHYFTVQPGWRIESATIRGSERALDVQADLADRSELVIWPEASDVANRNLRLQITGVIDVASADSRIVVPACWFIRPRDQFGRSIAAVIPPPETEWEMAAALFGRRILRSDLPASMKDILGPVPADALVFDLGSGATPELVLERPPAAFNSELRCDIERLGNEIIERLRVEFRVPAGRLPSVQIRTSGDADDSAFQWSLESTDESTGQKGTTTVTLQASALEMDAEGGQTWELQPSGGIRDGLVIVGERRYPAEQLVTPKQILLPTVFVTTSTTATTHRGSCHLGKNVFLTNCSENVVKVPAPKQFEPSAAGWLLRYASNETAAVSIYSADDPATPPIVWKEAYQILSSASGDDVVGEYQTDGSSPLEITHDPTLSVVNIEGRLLETDAGSSKLTVRPDESSGIVRVRWRRAIRSGRQFREVRIPEISTNALTVSRTCELWAAADSLLLARGDYVSPPAWMDAEAQNVRASIPADGAVWIIPSSFAWAFSGPCALILAVIGWSLMRFKSWLVTPLVSALAVLAVMYPVWTVPVTGFVLVPLAVGSLMAVAAARLRTAPRTSSGNSVHSDQPPSNSRGSSAQLASTAIADRPSNMGKPFGQLMIMLFAITATVMKAGFGTAQDSNGTSTPRATVPVMIPVNEEGELAGDKVYIPLWFRDALFAPSSGSGRSARVDFRTADYQVRIDPTGMQGTPDIVSIEATWRIEVDVAEQPIYLPIVPSTLERMEVILDAVPTMVRPVPEGAGMTIRPPKSGSIILRAQMKPTVETTVAGANRINLPIPSVAASSLSIVSDSAFEQISLPQCQGEIERFDTGNRLTASLGAVKSLEIIWQRQGMTAMGALTNFSRRWLVQITRTQLSRELELAVGEGVRTGVVVDLLVGTSDAPVVTTPDWNMTRIESNDATQSRYRLVATIDSPEPIRLLWVTSLPEGNNFSAELPDVRPTSQAGPIDTLIGIQLPNRWELMLTNTGTDETTNQPVGADYLEPTDFAAQWRGYPVAVDTGRRTTSTGPVSFRISRVTDTDWTASEQHQVTLTRNDIRLQYSTTIFPGSVPQPASVIRLPKGMQVQSMMIAGEEIRPALTVVNELQEIVLAELSTEQETSIEIIGSIALADDGMFQPPRLRMNGIEVTSSDFYLRRTENLRIQEVQVSQELALASEMGQYDLTEGIIPLRSWQLNGGDDPLMTWVPAQFRVVAANPQFACESLTTLRWNDGLWNMQVTVDIKSTDQPADFITLEIPTRWVQGLDVQPAAKWSIQPTLSGNRHLLRILPTTTSEGRLVGGAAANASTGNQRITITSSLENPGDGGIVIPDIRVLGAGPRQRFFAAPRRLTSNAVTWQTQNARPEELPQQFADVAPHSETHQIYEVLGGTFLASLKPASGGTNVARSPLMEISLFPQQQQHCVAIQRLHLLPEDRESITFRIPAHIELLGIWAAGVPVPVRSIDGLAEIPTGISRLAQQIVLLYRLPPQSDAEQSVSEFPVPIDLNVDTTWVAYYADLPAVTQADWQQKNYGDFQAAVSQAVMKCLDESVDNVAERSTLEKQRWLNSWTSRLEQLGWTVPTEFTDSVQGTQWEEVNAWAPKLLQRVLGQESTLLVEDSTEELEKQLFAPSTWEPTLVYQQAGLATTLPDTTARPEQLWWRTHHQLLFNALLSLATFLFAALAVFWIGRQHFEHPAIWLVTIGVLAIVLTPLPIAVGLITVGLITPLLAKHQQRVLAS